ncbi:MAG: hypothetical protein ACRET6_14105 [Burkholderiales bacterium]
MSLRDEYFARMVSKFKSWDAEFSMLTERSEQLSADTRAPYDGQLEKLRANRDAAYKKLQEIRTTGESAWRGLQAGLDAAWGPLKITLDRLSTELKKMA